MGFQQLIKSIVPLFARIKLKTALARVVASSQSLGTWIRRPNIYRLNTPERLGVVYTAPTHLSTTERLFLYSIVRGLCPQRVLEIGSALGGSSAIIAAALEDNGLGTIVGIDPEYRIAPNLDHFGRFHFVKNTAPNGIDEARILAGGTFDLVFYDGPNIHSSVSSIFRELTAHLAERAFIIIDNGLHYGVHAAVGEAIQVDKRFHDSGFLCTKLGVHDRHVAYNGFRLLRFESCAVSDPQPIIEREYRGAGRPVPTFSNEVINHDGWYCRTVQKCPKCSSSQASP